MKSDLPLQSYHYEPVEIRHKHRLPHWITPHGIYFLTIHLLDAVPRELLEKWRAELTDDLRFVENEDEALARQREYIQKIEVALDRSYGANHLENDELAAALADTFAHDDTINYELLAWCIMPTHAHIVFRLLGRLPLDRIVKAWKRVSALAAQRLIGVQGSLWQDDYFDVLVRDNHHLLRAVEYTTNNPARNWRWVRSEDDRISQLT